MSDAKMDVASSSSSNGQAGSHRGGALDISAGEHHLRLQLDDLRSRLLAREERQVSLQTALEESRAASADGRAKYERLWESHRRLQKTNHTLEDKLLRVVDKFEADRNQLTRDLASQTQKLVQAKLGGQQLRDQITELQSDLQVALSLLQQKPAAFLPQKLGALPADVQSRVRLHLDGSSESACGKAGLKDSTAKRITVPIMDEVSGHMGDNRQVSAAILAKVLEERAKERRRDRQFCIDVGTQTHTWHFHPDVTSSPPDNNNGNSKSPNKASACHQQPHDQPARRTRPSGGSEGGGDVIQILRSISMDADVSASHANPSSTGGILFEASVIRLPPADQATGAVGGASFSTVIDPPPTAAATACLTRSATFSSRQTDV